MSREDRPSVFLVGRRMLSNEMIQSLLEEKAGVACHIVTGLSELPLDAGSHQATKRLLLLEYRRQELEAILSGLRMRQDAGSIHGEVVAFFNLPRDAGIEEKALRGGVQGFFYTEDSPEILLKGVRALLTGEIWLSRERLVQMALKGGDAPSQEMPRLTQRETEILLLISSGRTNDEIAQELGISGHTVKTHLYHIFKKIEVSNRLQAALWTARNLSGEQRL